MQPPQLHPGQMQPPPFQPGAQMPPQQYQLQPPQQPQPQLLVSPPMQQVPQQQVQAQPLAAGQATAAAGAVAVKSVWTEHVDKASGKTYYYNQSTKQSSWTKVIPDALVGDLC